MPKSWRAVRLSSLPRRADDRFVSSALLELPPGQTTNGDGLPHFGQKMSRRPNCDSRIGRAVRAVPKIADDMVATGSVRFTILNALVDLRAKLQSHSLPNAELAVKSQVDILLSGPIQDIAPGISIDPIRGYEGRPRC